MTRYLATIILGITFLNNCHSQSQPNQIIGLWKPERDTTLTIRFSNDSLYTYLSDSLITQERYSIKSHTPNGTMLYSSSGSDTSKMVIMGLSDSTLTLMDNMQGKILFYRKLISPQRQR